MAARKPLVLVGGVPAELPAADTLFRQTPYDLNFTAAGSIYVAAREAMTLAQGNAPIGTGTIAYAKSTNAAPGTFSNATLPVILEAGAWLRVTASAVTGFVAANLYRTA